MKKYIILFAGLVVSTLLVACADDKPNNGGGTVINCPAGTTFQNGYCVGPNGVVSNTGSVGFYSENWHDRTLTPTGGNGFREFLKNAMGVCDRNHSNGGTADCSAWMSGAFDVVMQAPNTQTNAVQVTFRAKPRMNQNYNYYYSLPSAGQLAGALLGFPVVGNPGAVRNPLQLNMTVSVTNNYQGFEARGYGDFYTTANRSLIQVQIGQGKLEDASFNYRIAYRGEVIMTGRFVRCNTADCGLSQPFGY